MIRGSKPARALLFEHVNSKTILVGHAVRNDLNVIGVVQSSPWIQCSDPSKSPVGEHGAL